MEAHLLLQDYNLQVCGKRVLLILYCQWYKRYEIVIQIVFTQPLFRTMIRFATLYSFYSTHTYIVYIKYRNYENWQRAGIHTVKYNT